MLPLNMICTDECKFCTLKNMQQMVQPFSNSSFGSIRCCHLFSSSINTVLVKSSHSRKAHQAFFFSCYISEYVASQSTFHALRES